MHLTLTILAVPALLAIAGCGQIVDSEADSNEPHPAWLVNREYTKGYKTENNIAFESEDKGIRFLGAPEFNYEQKTGKTWSKAGTWNVDGNDLMLSGASAPIDLSKALKAGCRLLDVLGDRYFTSGFSADGAGSGSGSGISTATGCPFEVELTAAECARVGSYARSESGGGSSTYSNSESVTLDPEGFFIRTSTRSSSVCYGSTCKSLYNEAAPTVGAWRLSNGVLRTDTDTTIDTGGMTFTAAGSGCGGQSSGPVCGNGTCEAGEAANCSDCNTGPICGNGVCEAGESESTCDDCYTPPVCGDGVCEAGESTSCAECAPPSARVDVYNNASVTIAYLYVSACSATEWGTSTLGTNVILPGGSVWWTNFPEGCWDFKAQNQARTLTWETFGNTIVGGMSYGWTLVDASAVPSTP